MNAGRHFSTDQLAIPSSKTGIWGTRPLPARLAQQQGETDLDDGGELTGEVPVEWIPNQASHGFLAWAEDLRGRQGLRRWNECEKGGEPGIRGYCLSSPGKQNGNSS